MNNLFTFAFTASFMLGTATVSAQTEYTVIKNIPLVNADFTADAPLSGITRLFTYSKDLLDDGLGAGGAGRFGLQAVTGWTPNILSDNIKNPERTDGADAKAGGIFYYLDESLDEDPNRIQFGNEIYAPYKTDASTQGLGVMAVWGAEAYYTQEVTLPAGAYMLVAKVQNTSGGGEIDNLFGFIASDTQSFKSSKKTYAGGADEWENDTVVFQIEEAVTGKVSIGYKSGNYASGSAPHLFFDNITLSEIDPAPLYKAQVDEIKKDLAELMVEAEFSGVDTKAAQAVYDDENATVEGVQAAIEALRKKIDSDRTDLSAFFFRNAHFEDDEAIPENDGICTYAKDMSSNNVHYSGMQPVSSWIANNPGTDGPASGVFSVGSNSFHGTKGILPPATLSDGSTEGKVLGIVTCWSGTAAYTQSVSLPKGKYTLKISYYNAKGTNKIAKNLMGFVTNDGVEFYGASTSFPEGKWTSETVSFELGEETAGNFSMGYLSPNEGSSNLPHLFIDGISLYYSGEMNIDPSLFALQASVKSAKELEGEYFSEELEQQLADLIEKGDELVSSSSDDADLNTETAKALNDIVPVIKANIAAYENLETFKDETLAEAMEKYENVESLYEALEELKDEADVAYDDCTWSTEKINETIASLSDIIKAGIKKVFDEAVETGETPEGGLDISVLYDQLAYTYSESAVSGGNVPDKEWSYGDAGNFKTQYGTAEVWNQSPFKVSRTLKDMPAGTYTITTKGFFRNANNADNLVNASDPDYVPEAAVFAGYNKTALANVKEIASDTEIEGWVNVDGVYVPNSQKTGYDLFNNDEYTEVLEKSVQTVLAEAGDLTFGVKAEQMNADSWVLWYSFDVKYNGPVDNDVMSAELENVIAETKAYKEENVDNMNNAGNTDADVAIEKAEAAVGTTAEAMAAAVKTAQDALEAMKANVEAVAAYATAEEALMAAAENPVENCTPAADVKFTEVSAKMEGKDDLSTEDLLALIDEMEYAASLFRIPAVPADASDAKPFDMTSVIVNPDFEDEEDGLKGWSYFKGSDTQAADNSNDTYFIVNASGAKVFNTWNGSAPEGGFYVSQDLGALPAGTYELTVLVASDKGNTINVTAGEFGYSLVTENEKNVGTDVKVVFTVKEGDALTAIKVQSNNWFKADNFRLAYFGTNSQKETTGVDGIESADAEIAAIYNAAGAKVNALTKGVNIITYKNGTTKKVILK